MVGSILWSDVVAMAGLLLELESLAAELGVDGSSDMSESLLCSNIRGSRCCLCSDDVCTPVMAVVFSDRKPLNLVVGVEDDNGIVFGDRRLAALDDDDARCKADTARWLDADDVMILWNLRCFAGLEMAAAADDDAR